MHGDFSRGETEKKDNFIGVLHQQGRVLTDADWNAQTRITNDWQDQAGNDIVGSGVAAVPADVKGSFKVETAIINADGNTELTVNPGRVWADGLLTYLPGNLSDPIIPISRTASYLQPPIQDPTYEESTIGRNIRDAVVLEVRREAINGFQMPKDFIEPALGGPDTTVRVRTAAVFRLFRLQPGDTCESIRDQLRDDFSQKGKLTASLQPTEIINGECPVAEGGGYTGFEHQLYRIEIADIDRSDAMFKWSQFNGSLVGRGTIDATDATAMKVRITSNKPTITTSGLTEFYMEVVQYDDAAGQWKVTYGAEVTLNSDHEIALPATAMFGILPSTSNSIFFRLWNGIRLITDFPQSADPTELRDGIRLEFDPPAGGKYNPGDYWIFSVRAGEIANNEVLIDNEPPEGIHYHRVPLAILNWNATANISAADNEIYDCRHIFQPLTRLGACCTFRVGDGVHSHGDFDSLEEAIIHLPSTGGELCLLPGVHRANLEIQNKRNIRIRGCGKETLVMPHDDQLTEPIFKVIDSQCVFLEDMDIVTYSGTAIVATSTEGNNLEELVISNNRILAIERAISIYGGVDIKIRHNRIRMLDKEGADVAIFMRAEDVLIERNDIGVIPANQVPPGTEDPGNGDIPDPVDPCTDHEVVYLYSLYSNPFTLFYLNFPLSSIIFSTHFKAKGGIQIAGGAERIRILENKIRGGAGNGIMLGTEFGAVEQPVDEEATEEFFIEHDSSDSVIAGSVLSSGVGEEGISLLFTSNALQYRPVPTNEDGSFKFQASEGNFRVEILTPGWTIENVDKVPSDTGISNYYYNISIVEKVDEQQELEILIGFLYEIDIDTNEISQMGLSGIGIPMMDTSAASITASTSTKVSNPILTLHRLLGNPIVHLIIGRNHIFNCFQSPLNELLRNYLRKRGLGGISLGICEGVTVNHNRIEDNGLNHLVPVCGMYIYYVERAEINDNRIINNGQLTTINLTDMERGVRSGISLIASSFTILDLIEKRQIDIQNDRPAVRIHNNEIAQPAGRALTILALGPISVSDNWLNSEFMGTETMDLLFGTVMILNLGGIQNNGTGTPSTNEKLSTQLPGGETQFNCNQSRLGTEAKSFLSQLIFSMDDVGFCDNQSSALGPGITLQGRIQLLLNSLVGGDTVRANANRLKEGIDPEFYRKISLFTASQLANITTYNQGDHCILATSSNPVMLEKLGNQELDTTLCSEFTNTISGVRTTTYYYADGGILR